MLLHQRSWVLVLVLTFVHMPVFGQGQTVSKEELKTRIEQRYTVLPIQNGIVLSPKNKNRTVSVEISGFAQRDAGRRNFADRIRAAGADLPFAVSGRRANAADLARGAGIVGQGILADLGRLSDIGRLSDLGGVGEFHDAVVGTNA